MTFSCNQLDSHYASHFAIEGFSFIIKALFRRGFFFLGASLISCLFFGFRALWISSELMIRVRSEIAIVGRGSTKPFFDEASSRDPYKLFNFVNASSVHTINLPTWPPGATCSRFSLSTQHSSIPGRLRKALTIPLSSPYTMSGPLFCTYLLFRIFPLPVRIFLLFLAFSTSASAPRVFNTSAAFEVFCSSCTSLLITRGTSGTSEISCPLDSTSGCTAEAARADARACLKQMIIRNK
mmetsp:Transcript_33407/g.131755  ORF Transcript_33407/g.131755 Transcript_33407/m.131755 type:complete len:238 (-) Transcript_33407:566-1279(-)